MTIFAEGDPARTDGGAFCANALGVAARAKQIVAPVRTNRVPNARRVSRVSDRSAWSIR
jgi:hypothetical protein